MHPWIRRLLPLLCVGLTACQTIHLQHIHSSEMEPFTPLPPSQRVMNVVKLRWELRDDVAAYCAQATGMDREKAYITPPLACAIWSVAAKECTIVTGTVTSHLAVGHEVRHCFEGRFHQ